MARSLLLLAVLCMLACASGESLRAQAIRLASGDAYSDGKPSCLSYADSASCLQHGCGWCSNDLLGEQCMAKDVAKLVPTSIASCELPGGDDDAAVNQQQAGSGDAGGDTPKAPASCSDNKEKADCLDLGAEEGECAWCKGDKMTPRCMTAKKAKWIPEPVAHCKMPKGKKQLQAGGGDKPKPKAPVSCGDNKEKADCLDLGAEEGECAWCKGDFMPASCVATKAAEWIPETVAHCKMPKGHKKEQKQLQAGGGDAGGGGDKPKPKAPVSCGDNKEKADCLDLGAEEGECAWCKGDFMPASCVATKAAEWIPETVAHCKMPKGHKKEQKQLQAGGGDKPKPKAPVSCGDNKEKADCLDLGAEEGECAWCKGDFMPASCVATKAAEWIPETVAHCKMPKGHKDSAADGANALDKKHNSKSKGGADWPSGGGDWPSGGGDWPSGGGSKGGGAAGGQGCMAETHRKKCLRAKDASGGCAWCEKSFLGSNKCVSQTSVKYLPKMVADCEMPKKDKKASDAVATS